MKSLCTRSINSIQTNQGESEVKVASFNTRFHAAVPTLAKYAKSYEAIRTGASDLASDYYPVLAEFVG